MLPVHSLYEFYADDGSDFDPLFNALFRISINLQAVCGCRPTSSNESWLPSSVRFVDASKIFATLMVRFRVYYNENDVGRCHGGG